MPLCQDFANLVTFVTREDVNYISPTHCTGVIWLWNSHLDPFIPTASSCSHSKNICLYCHGNHSTSYRQIYHYFYLKSLCTAEALNIAIPGGSKFEPLVSDQTQRWALIEDVLIIMFCYHIDDYYNNSIMRKQPIRAV